MRRPIGNFRSPDELVDIVLGWLDSRRGRWVLSVIAAGLAVAIVLSPGAFGAKAKRPLPVSENPLTPTFSATTAPPASRASVPPATVSPTTVPPTTVPPTTVPPTTVPPTTVPPTTLASPTFPPATSPPATFPPATFPPATAPPPTAPPAPPSSAPPDTGIVVPQ